MALQGYTLRFSHLFCQNIENRILILYFYQSESLFGIFFTLSIECIVRGT